MNHEEKLGLSLGNLLERNNPFRALIPLKQILFAGLLGALFLEFSSELHLSWAYGLELKVGGADVVVALSACITALLLVLIDFWAADRHARVADRLWTIVLDPATPPKMREQLLKHLEKR